MKIKITWTAVDIYKGESEEEIMIFDTQDYADNWGELPDWKQKKYILDAIQEEYNKRIFFDIKRIENG